MHDDRPPPLTKADVDPIMGDVGYSIDHRAAATDSIAPATAAGIIVRAAEAGWTASTRRGVDGEGGAPRVRVDVYARWDY